MADVSFVVLERAARPDVSAMMACDAGLGLTATEREEGDKPVVLQLGDGTPVFVMVIDAPHPDAPGMPQGPTSPSAEEIAASPAHAIVTLMGGSEGDPQERDVLLARVTAAAIAGLPAIGAMLGHGVLMHRADVFEGIVQHAVGEGALPVEVLVDVTAARESDERMSFLTHGLARYGREEFYVTCPVAGSGALGFVYQMSAWMLLDPAKQLPTGDTLGRTAEERIEIQRVPSPTGQGDLVIRLDL